MDFVGWVSSGGNFGVELWRLYCGRLTGLKGFVPLGCIFIYFPLVLIEKSLPKS